MKKLLLTLVLAPVFLFTLVGCGSDGNGGNEESELVGAWEFDSGEVSSELTFNTNGTGFQHTELIGIESSDSFEWVTTDGVISLEFEDGSVEEWSYSIDGDNLTIIILEEDFERTYSRVQ